MSKTNQYEERALRVIPGYQSNLRVPMMDKPFCMLKGQGVRLWDVDGREYIDYLMGAGQGILGHGNQEYLDTLKNQLDLLYYSFGGNFRIPQEVELAEKFVELVPCAEKVRFLVTGSEAVQLIIRLARAHTGRRYFIRFAGHYHGWMDNVLGGDLNPDRNGRPHPLECAPEDPRFTKGKDSESLKQSFLLRWNDIEELESVLSHYGEEVALIHMEPVVVNGGCCPPKPGYLERVRELCDQYGIVLSFDEVITGFRLGLGGAQGTFGVIPDLASFGKSFGGGLPVSAVAGKSKIMDLLLNREVIGAGTFNGYPLGIAASLATIKIMEKDNGAFYRHVDKHQQRLMSEIRAIASKNNIQLLLQGPLGAIGFLFTDKPVVYASHEIKQTDLQKLSRFSKLMLEEGIMMGGARWYISGGITSADVDQTLECVERVMTRL